MPASAQEVVLRAVTSFAEGTQFSKNFERFIEKVNADGKGVIRINYIGGPRAMPPFEVGNAVRTKVVDIANVTGAFYTNLMPEADGFKLIAKPMSEQRQNGTWEFINQLHNQKLNAQYLARQFHNVPFHIYLNKKPDKLDFTGLKIRVTPVYKDIVEALGGTAITTAPGEVYTALERGVVDGYGWPVSGIFDLGWDKVTKFRLEPAFYSVEVNVLVNLDTWKALSDAQRKVLSDAALWLEGLDAENTAVVAAERERQAKAGIQPIDFGPEEAKKFLEQGERGRVAVGDQARAGKRREAAAAGGELTRLGLPPRRAAGSGPARRRLFVDRLGDRDDVLVGTGLAGFGELLALLGQLGEVHHRIGILVGIVAIEPRPDDHDAVLAACEEILAWGLRQVDHLRLCGRRGEQRDRKREGAKGVHGAANLCCCGIAHSRRSRDPELGEPPDPRRAEMSRNRPIGACCEQAV